MTSIQSTQFASALSAWMSRERLTVGRAARWLGIKCRDLEAWTSGDREPSAAEITRVLSRIAASGK